MATVGRQPAACVKWESVWHIYKSHEVKTKNTTPDIRKYIGVQHLPSEHNIFGLSYKTSAASSKPSLQHCAPELDSAASPHQCYEWYREPEL